MSSIVERIRSELRQNAAETTRKSGERFFKETVKLYGVKTALVGRIAKESFRGIKDLSKYELFKICEELWKSGYLEESFVACTWSQAVYKLYEPGDFKIFQKWVDTYVGNWASCDTFCNHTVGTFIERYPEFLIELKKWASSKNRWLRRGAAVSLIVPARHGKFLTEIFEIADRLLTDTDDLVQKGYGWMLKAASQASQLAVFDFVMKRKAIMPRTALRYAIEKMPPELKSRAMKK